MKASQWDTALYAIRLLAANPKSSRGPTITGASGDETKLTAEQDRRLDVPLGWCAVGCEGCRPCIPAK